MVLCVGSVQYGFFYFPIKGYIFFLVGEVLATYEENTRDFLFPDPKLTCGHHGLDREILMKRSSSFTVSEYLWIVFMIQCVSLKKPLELLQMKSDYFWQVLPFQVLNVQIHSWTLVNVQSFFKMLQEIV